MNILEAKEKKIEFANIQLTALKKTVYNIS